MSLVALVSLHLVLAACRPELATDRRQPVVPAMVLATTTTSLRRTGTSERATPRTTTPAPRPPSLGSLARLLSCLIRSCKLFYHQIVSATYASWKRVCHDSFTIRMPIRIYMNMSLRRYTHALHSVHTPPCDFSVLFDFSAHVSDVSLARWG